MPYYAFDLHTHTTNSDGLSSVDEMIRQAKYVGLSGLAITDHDIITPVPEKDGNLLLIPSSEVTTLRGHVLALGVNETIPEQRGVAETIDLVHEAGGLAVCAHPFNLIDSISNHEFYKYRFDAYESFNANSINSFVNDLLKNFPYARGMPQIGATDSHHYSTVGRAYTIVESDELSLESILKSIRNGQTSSEGSIVSTYEFYKIFLKSYTRRGDKTSDESFNAKVVQTLLSYLPENVGYATFFNLIKLLERRQRNLLENKACLLRPEE